MAGTLGAGLGTALTAVLLHAVVAVTSEPVLLREAGQMAPGFGVTVLLLLAIFALGWAIAWRAGARSNAALAAWSGFVGTAYLFAVKMRLLTGQPEVPGYHVAIAASILSGIAAAFGLYRGVKFAGRHPAALQWIRRTAQAALIILLGATASFVFAGGHGSAIVILGAALVAAGLSAKLSVRAYAAALGVTTLLLLAGGAVCFARLTPFAVVPRAEAVTAGHEVRHVLLLTVDTLRADTLSYASPTAPPTPNIDRLAGESVVFENAYSAASWTLPSLASIHTGLPVFTHGRSRGELDMAPEFPMLAEIMQQAGYRTAGIVENFFLASGYGFSRGFDQFAAFPRGVPLHEMPGRGILRHLFPDKYPSGETVTLTRLAVDWLKKHRDEDFFLWVHYFDPHIPYAPPAAYLPKQEPPTRIGTEFRDSDKLRDGSLTPDAHEVAWLRALYQGEVRHVDDNIGELMTTLRELGLYDDTLIVFTSDHGEEFREHERFEHGHSLYNEVIHVPLAIKPPGGSQGLERRTPVGNYRVMPTILEQCGLKHPGRCDATPSLGGYLDGGEDPETPDLPVVVSGVLYYQDLESLIQGRYKLLHRVQSDAWEFYDLKDDPGERVPIQKTAREAFQAARAELKKERTRYQKLHACYQPTYRVPRPLSESQMKMLKSLGYVQ